MRHSSHKTLRKKAIPWLVLALCVLTAQGAAEAANGVCVSARMDEPFRLPDGSKYPGGKLTLCHHSDYSPVASFHRTKVDGITVSMQQSRRSESERGDSDAPFMMFARAQDGTLVLLGYAHAGGDKATVYAFPPVEKPRQSLQARPAPPPGRKAAGAWGTAPVIRLPEWTVARTPRAPPPPASLGANVGPVVVPLGTATGAGDFVVSPLPRGR